jgi:hypothetical protein
MEEAGMMEKGRKREKKDDGGKLDGEKRREQRL